jgi:hypothetical protein
VSGALARGALARGAPAFVLAGLGLRLAWPLADPAAGLSWSNGIYTDPASVVHAARNAALFGEWIRDGSRDLVFFPLLNVLTWIAYGAFGPSRLATQVLAAVLGSATAGLCALAVAKSSGREAGGIGALLLASCWWLVMFSRVPVAENLAAALLAAACVAALSDRPIARLLAGFVAAGAFCFGKLHAVAFVPALAAFLVLRRGGASSLWLPLAGSLVALALWGVLIFLPFRDEIAEQLRAAGGLYGSAPILSSPAEAASEILRTVRYSWLFHRMPLLAALGAWFALSTLADPGARRRRLENGSALFALWFLASWVYLTLLPYKAPRYFVLSAVPLVVCAACQIAELSRKERIPWNRPRRFSSGLALVLWTAAAAYAAVDSLRHYLTMLRDLFAIPRSAAAVRAYDFLDAASFSLYSLRLSFSLALVLAAAALWLGWRHASERSLVRRRITALDPRAAAAALAALAVTGSLAQYGWWAAHRTYALEESKRSLAAIVGEGAVLYGAFAPVLTQDTRLVAVPQFGAPDGGAPATHGVTHLLLGRPEDTSAFERANPDLLDSAVPIRAWPLRTRHLRAVELHALPFVPAGGYAPSEFELGAAAMEEGRLEEALEHFAAFRRQRPVPPDVPSLEARCLYGLGDTSASKERLLEALRLSPTNPADHYNLGNLLLRDGDAEGARRAWMRGLALDPFDETMSSALRELTLGGAGRGGSR